MIRAVLLAPCGATAKHGNDYFGNRRLLQIVESFDCQSNTCGMEKEAWDGKSFHAFRRTVGKWLMESSTDAQMISQILGQRDREVLKRYLPLAPDILRECSLDFTYAPLRSEVYQ